jgi:hypothetical protein
MQEVIFPDFMFTAQVDVVAPLSATALPALVHLRHLHVQHVHDQTGILDRIFAFMHYHPTIEELEWSEYSIPIGYANPPFLPSLKRIRDHTGTDRFLHFYLFRHTPGTLHLETLDFAGICTPALLVALSSSSLRVLRMRYNTSFATLRTLAHMFPAVEELFLPSQDSIRRMAPSIAVGAWRLLLARGNRDVLCRPTLQDVCSLFSHLRTVRGTHFGVSASLRETNGPLGAGFRNNWSWPQLDNQRRVVLLKELRLVRERYPKLDTVDGWMVRKDGDPVLLRDLGRQPNAWMRFAGVRLRFVFKRDGYSVEYATNANGALC